MVFTFCRTIVKGPFLNSLPFISLGRQTVFRGAILIFYVVILRHARVLLNDKVS